MLSAKGLSVVWRGRKTMAVAALFATLSAGTAETPRMHGAAMLSMVAAAQPLTLSCNPCTIPAEQKTNVRFTLQVPATMAGTSDQLTVSRIIPGRAPTELGTMSRDTANGNIVTFSLSTAFFEQAGTFSVEVFAEPAGRAAMMSTAQRSIASPVQITVQNNVEPNTNTGSTLGGFLGALKQIIGSGGSTTPPNNNAAPNQNPTGNNAAQGQTPPADRVNAPPTIRAQGFSFNIPPGFAFHQEIADAGGPVSLRNFDQYVGRGVVPQGGAEIEVTSVPAGSTSLQTLLRAETNAQSIQGITVDTLPAQKALYTDVFGPGWSYDSQATYVLQDGRIYKFFLTYRSGDAGSPAYQQAFSTVLNTTHFSAR